MINLAGKEDCDDYIRKELERARIDIVECERVSHEVSYSLTGKLGPFIFSRAWRYWVADGPMPYNLAVELYEDPVGKEDVRSGGDCACRHPSTWATYYDADGKELCTDWDGKQEEMIRNLVNEKYFNGLKFIPGPQRKSEAASILLEHATRVIVDTYHIDTEVGLRLFADTIRRELLNEK